MKNKWLASLVFICSGLVAMEGQQQQQVASYDWLALDNQNEIMQYILNERVIESTHGIYALAYSPDGTSLAVGGGDDKVTIRNTTDYEIIKKLNHDGKVWALAYSPDGKVLAVGDSNNKVTIWDMVNYKPFEKLKLHNHSVSAIAYCPDGTSLAIGGGGEEVYIWDTVNYEVITSLKHDDWALALAYCSDGSSLAVGRIDYKVTIWDTVDYNVIKEFEHDGMVNALAYSPDGTSLATGGDDSKVTIRDTVDYKIIKELNHDDWVHALAYSPDGQSLAVAYSNKIIIRDVFAALLNSKKKAAIKTLRHYIFAKTLEDRKKNVFPLSQDGHETWQELKEAYGDEFALYKKMPNRQETANNITPIKRALVRKGFNIDGMPLKIENNNSNENNNDKK